MEHLVSGDVAVMVERDYAAGDSTPQIGARYGIHHATVHRYLVEAGLARTQAQSMALRAARNNLPRDVNGLAKALDMSGPAMAELLQRHGFLLDIEAARHIEDPDHKTCYPPTHPRTERPI